MMYIKPTIFIAALFAILSINECCFAQSKTRKQKNISFARTTIEHYYKDINGFVITPDESNYIAQHEGNATYGEITFNGLQTLLDDLPLTRHDVFYDLGSGVGKVCVQVALTTPIRKIVGVELSHTRYVHADKIARELVATKKMKPHRLHFLEENINDVSLKDATVVFMLSTCFSDKLMHSIVNKLHAAHNGLRVITQKKLSDHKEFVLIKEYRVQTTWSKNVPMYLYILKK